MRISILKKREPFEKILSQTLISFWTEKYKDQFSIDWYTGNFTWGNKEHQKWHINNYLNAIFSDSVDSISFDPLRREFSRSCSVLKRPFQRAYVFAATSDLFSSWLAQNHFFVFPSIPNASDLMVVPGNHKIRILDFGQKCCWSSAKAGFSVEPIVNEIHARKSAENFELPVPKILDISTNGYSFCEEYVAGTPLNRVPSKVMANAAYHQAANALIPMMSESKNSLLTYEYVECLRKEIFEHLASIHVLENEQKFEISNIVDRLCNLLNESSCELWLCQAHGDFQPANLLLDRKMVWIIDWEYTRQCQAGYDGLVYELAARFPKGLAERLQNFIESYSSKIQWPGANWKSPRDRFQASVLFCLEELLLHLKENNNQMFISCGEGLLILIKELHSWLEINS